MSALRCIAIAAALLATGCAVVERPLPRQTSAAAIESGAALLGRTIDEGNYGLACRASDGSSCPVHGAGHLFAAFFIADAVGDALSAAQRQRLLERLDAEARDGVWGYMRHAPVDSDDTAFAIRASRLLGRSIPADPVLRFFARDRQAFTTFQTGTPGPLTFEASVAGNSGIHPEVNANIFTLLLETPFATRISYELIGRSQDSDGSWRSYFYPGPYYATYMSLGLLCRADRLEDARQRGIAFLLRSQNGDGSWGAPGGPYATALSLNALSACGAGADAISKGIAYLLGRQTSEGRWRDEGVVVWEYRYSDHPTVIWRAYDLDGIVTTALAVKALRAWASFRPLGGR